MTGDRFVLFRGKRYLLTTGGALTTQEDFEAFRESYAHVYPDHINRYGENIGDPSELIDDGEYTGDGPSMPIGVALEKMLSWPAFNKKE